MSARGIALSLAASALLAAWMLRYDIVPVAAGGQGDVGYAYKLDRWTGKVRFLIGANDRATKEQP